MINRLFIYQGTSFDPHYNLAVEKRLLESVEPGCCILYLWQNQNTVVIGKNQNAWKECRTALLNEEDGTLARRLSGGGAVFHDLGNLNFTFLMPQAEYDLDRQFAVITEAVGLLGVQAERSGRNDVLSEGRKFSGNAFYKNGKQAYHHGTLLVDVDMDKLSRYLNPSKAKLQAKGVDSVRSRVVNLKEMNPEITIEKLKAAMATAFEKVYALPCSMLDDQMLDRDAIELLRQRNASWDWNYGPRLPFSVEFEERFPWGGLQICLQIENGHVLRATVYSDAMDWSVAPKLEELLTGCRFAKTDLISRARGLDSEFADSVCAMIEQQDL